MANNLTEPARKRKIIRNLLFIAALLIFTLMAVWGRAYIGSMRDFSKGESFFIEKEYVKAITFFDRAMHWYAPLNPYVERSAEYLMEISNEAEKINDTMISLIALETIRNSFYGTRSFYNTGVGWIDKSNKKIAYIVGNLDENKLISDCTSGIGHHLYLIRTKYNDPVIFWTVILGLGFLGWIGSVIGWTHFCLGKDIKPRKILYSNWFWISLAFINYGFWLLGIVRA